MYDKLKPQFTCNAFVSVSQTPDLTKVFKDMLYELDKTEYKNIHNTTMGQKRLIDLILDILQHKRYVLWFFLNTLPAQIIFVYMYAVALKPYVYIFTHTSILVTNKIVKIYLRYFTLINR